MPDSDLHGEHTVSPEEGTTAWLNAAAALAVGACFFALWFWLLPGWLGFRVETAGAALWQRGCEAGAQNTARDAQTAGTRIDQDVVDRLAVAGARRAHGHCHEAHIDALERPRYARVND